MPMNDVAAIIIAAGSSSRLGQPKQLLIFEGETLLQRAIRIAEEAGASPVLVVLGAHRSHGQGRRDRDDCRQPVGDPDERGGPRGDAGDSGHVAR